MAVFKRKICDVENDNKTTDVVTVKEKLLKRLFFFIKVGVIVAFSLVCVILINNSYEYKYNDAIVLMNEGEHDEAYKIFLELGEYKDSSKKACDIRLRKNIEQFQGMKVGDYIKFGVYEQDNNLSNGKEEIEWYVIDIKDGKALVMSKYALDCVSYNDKCEGSSWDNSSIRRKLNNDFINDAFSEDERECIPIVTVLADKNPEFSTNQGIKTQDRIFFLSIDEVKKYCKHSELRKCQPTTYAIENGSGIDKDNGNCCWWLRTTGVDRESAAYVDAYGEIFEGGDFIFNKHYAVRPVMWINLNT